MKFNTINAVVQFYDKYAKSLGFSTRKESVRKGDEGEIAARLIVCSKEGERKEKYMLWDNRVREPKVLTRIRCGARIRFTRRLGQFFVSNFVSEHNHEFTPATQVHAIPKYRGLNNGDKSIVNSMHSYGIRTCHILGCMMGAKGGHSSLGFTKKDLYNHINRSGKEKLGKGDSWSTLSKFQDRANKDPMLFSKFTHNEKDQSLENMFWCDGTSRVDYECFGDVIAFDATYKRNKYDKPLVIFSGLNHHREIVIFGCGLVADEKKETYRWLLDAFLEAMSGKAPRGVVIDGDLAMKDAIKCTFPDATHHLCAWHLFNNAVEKVKNSAFLEDFRKLVYENYTPHMFERKWNEVVDRHGLS